MSATVTPQQAGRAGAREWLGLAVLALPTLLLALDNTVLFLALPHLSADLGPSSTELLWITDIYGFMIAGLLVTMGTLGDRIGRRRRLLIGAAAFGLASALTAWSTNPGMLIATRALLGIAGATLMPSTLALISNMFRDPRQRSQAIAVWMSCFLAGALGGPIVGGALLEHFWWGSAFLLGVPIMGLLLATGPILLPEYRNPSAARLDLVSVAMSLAAILPVTYGLKHIAAHGPGVLAALALASGTVLAGAFIRRQRRLTNPLVDVRLFADPLFSTALAVLLLATLMLGGALLFITQHLQLVQGLSPMQSGLWMALPAATMIAGNLLTPRLARRAHPATAIAVGLVISSAGFLMLTQVGDEHSLALVITGFSVVGIGISPLAVLGTDLVIGAAPPAKAGSAASLSETCSELGTALGIAILGSLGTAVYRAEAADTLPTALPPDAAHAGRDSLAAAVTAAEHLPAGPAAHLLDTTREAFTSGLTTVATVSAAAMALFAALVARTHRRARASRKSAAGAAETE